MFTTVVLTAIALVFVLEGLLPFMFPNFWKKMMQEATKLDENQLRLVGLTSIIIGLFLLWLLA